MTSYVPVYERTETTQQHPKNNLCSLFADKTDQIHSDLDAAVNTIIVDCALDPIYPVTMDTFSFVQPENEDRTFAFLNHKRGRAV